MGNEGTAAVEATATPPAQVAQPTTPAAATPPPAVDPNSPKSNTVLADAGHDQAAAIEQGKGEPTVTKPVEPKAIAPEKYELKVPQGSLLDAAQVEKITSFAKERGLSNDEAQSYLEREHEAVAGFADKQKAAFEAKQNEWAETLKNDPEIGGVAQAKSAELAKRVIERFGNETLKQELNGTRLGNYPELVRIFVKIGQAMSEDQLVLPGASTSGQPKPIEDVFYGAKSQ